MVTNHKRTVPFLKRVMRVSAMRVSPFFFFILSILIPIPTEAQESEYDEILVFFNMPRIGGAEMPALVKDEDLFLSVTDIFTFLKIYNTYSPGFDTISGFVVNPQAKFLIDRINSKIVYNGDVFNIDKNHIVRTETNIYLKSNYFGQIFGLECSFNFRNLSVTLNTRIELPLIREMRLEQMRKNISQLSGNIIADTTIGKSSPFFRFGMADWSITSNQIIGGSTDTRLTLNLGSVLAGGEANASINYNIGQPFDYRDQTILWRFADNNRKALKQSLVGNVPVDAISTMNAPIMGVQFTNSPTTYRRSYGTYTLSDVTEPGWMVELYVNNVLVDYKKADASGFFSFDVPLMYGNTAVKLQFYGPWGEERSKERSIVVPFNFLPVGEIEYKLTAGVAEDSTFARYSKANIDYGVTSFLTLGAGVEYLSSIASGNFMPFARASLRITPSLLLSGEYIYGVSTEGILNYRLGKSIQIDGSYKIYNKGQSAIQTNFVEERKLSVTAPIKTSKFTLFSRLSLNQFIMPASKYTASELLLSGVLFGVNTNLTTSAIFSSTAKPDIYSNLAIAVRLPFSIQFNPQTQFSYTKGKFMSVRAGLEKRLTQRGYVNFAFDHNFEQKSSSIELGFRYDFNFGKFGFSARRSNSEFSFTESASGSIIVDTKNKYIGTSNRANVGKGGITALAYLDENGNGKRDPGEKKAKGLQLRLNGGRIEYSEKDTLVRVFDLEPYANYLISLTGTSFDNISWQLPYKNIAVVSDPNQFKLLEIPIVVMGEAAGMVYLKSGDTEEGQGRILVNYYRSDSTLVKSVMTEDDGYYTYMGLKPGKYFVKVDPEQMRKLNMKASPESIDLTIQRTKEGEYIEGIDFVIEKRPAADTVGIVAYQDEIVKDEKQLQVQLQQPDSTKTGKVSPAEAMVSDTSALTLDSSMYSVQILALRKHIGSLSHFIPLASAVPGIKIYEKPKFNGFYRYRAGIYETRVEAEEMVIKSRSLGWKDAFVVYGPIVGFRPIPTKGLTNQNVESVKENIPEKADTVSLISLQDSVAYKVQLLTVPYEVDVDKTFGELMAAIPGLKVSGVKGYMNLYRYTTQNLPNYREAILLQNKIVRKGWKDCLIVKTKVIR